MQHTKKDLKRKEANHERTRIKTRQQARLGTGRKLCMPELRGDKGTFGRKSVLQPKVSEMRDNNGQTIKKEVHDGRR